MPLNPYDPPEHAAQPPLAPATPVAAPRLISAWLLVLLLAVNAAVGGSYVLRTTWTLVTHLDAVDLRWWLVFALVWRAVIVVAFVVVAFGVVRRRRWARWMGALALAGIAVYATLRPDATPPTDDAQATVILYLCVTLLFGGWIHAFAFSAKARRYFAVDGPALSPSVR